MTTEDENDEGSGSTLLAKGTISRYFTAFRDAIGMEMLEKYNKKIGGVNCVVEIDESMFGKVNIDHVVLQTVIR